MLGLSSWSTRSFFLSGEGTGVSPFPICGVATGLPAGVAPARRSSFGGSGFWFCRSPQWIRIIITNWNPQKICLKYIYIYVWLKDLEWCFGSSVGVTHKTHRPCCFCVRQCADLQPLTQQSHQMCPKFQSPKPLWKKAWCFLGHPHK
jgi:hypothetical protein